MTQRMSHSSARLHARRVPHVPRALSHSANLLMVPRMQALMTRLSRRACRSACKNKDRARNHFYRTWWLRRVPVLATRQKVQWRRTRMSSGVRPKLASCSSSSSLSHARMLAWVVVSPNKPAHQARSGFQRSGRARGHASARKLNGHRQPPDLIAEEAHFRTRARASAGRKLPT